MIKLAVGLLWLLFVLAFLNQPQTIDFGPAGFVAPVSAVAAPEPRPFQDIQAKILCNDDFHKQASLR